MEDTASNPLNVGCKKVLHKEADLRVLFLFLHAGKTRKRPSHQCQCQQQGSKVAANLDLRNGPSDHSRFIVLLFGGLPLTLLRT